MSYSKMPSNSPWLRIIDMKIDSKKRQQNKRPDNYETVLICFQGAATNFLVMCGFLAFSFVVRHVLNSTALVDGDE